MFHEVSNGNTCRSETAISDALAQCNSALLGTRSVNATVPVRDTVEGLVSFDQPQATGSAFQASVVPAGYPPPP